MGTTVLDDLGTTGESISQEEEEGNEYISAEEVEPTTSSPTESLALMRQLDKYLRSHNARDKMLRLQAKIQQYVVDKLSRK